MEEQKEEKPKKKISLRRNIGVDNVDQEIVLIENNDDGDHDEIEHEIEHMLDELERSISDLASSSSSSSSSCQYEEKEKEVKPKAPLPTTTTPTTMTTTMTKQTKVTTRVATYTTPQHYLHSIAQMPPPRPLFSKSKIHAF